jgi:4-aminobutyrate aminotransferase-like enzyme
VTPDFITIGKPAGNGHPVGAVITRPEILSHFLKAGPFFSTFWRQQRGLRRGPGRPGRDP